MRLTTTRLSQDDIEDDFDESVDPREQQSAEVIDLASRNAYPLVVQRKPKSDGLGLLAGVGLVALLGAVTLWSMNSARLENDAVGTVPVDQVVLPPPPADLPDPAYDNLPPPPEPVPMAAPPPPMMAQPINPAPLPMATANPLTSPAMVFDASSTAPPITEGLPAAAAASDMAVAGGDTDTSSVARFASRVGGVGGAAAQATPMANPSTTVTQGTLIPAVLETAINTNVPGFVRAVVSKDVRSFDGTRILVPRSSRLIGQYQSGLQNGQKRAYVIWTRLIRPDGASVNLASPAVGFDGTTGLAGKVDSNFFQRFGSALLLSVVGGLSNLASGGASVVLGGGQNAAATALEQNGQIGPTVRVKQGAPIRIFTARDLDFTQVSGG